MAEKMRALAVGAHPDDVEFMMGGTLSLLAQAGFEPHIMTLCNGSCGTAQYSEDEIILIRREEAQKAAAVIGAEYHPGLVNDLMAYYEDKLVRRATAVMRDIAPTIVLVPSLADYMEDHMITARVIVTALFCRGMMNYFSIPKRNITTQDVYLYHAQPYQNRDGMRNLIMPDLFVDVGGEMEKKEDMLRGHASQKDWLDVSQGQDSYLVTMRDINAETAKLSGKKTLKYAEGFRQHSHLGFSAEDKDMLSEVLGKRVTKRRKR